MCVDSAMQHYLYFFRIIYRKRGCAVKAKRDTHSDNGQRSKTRGLLQSLPRFIRWGNRFRAYGTVHSVFVPTDVRLFRAVHLCLRARCIFVLIPHRCIFEVLFWENLKKPLKNGEFVNLK